MSWFAFSLLWLDAQKRVLSNRIYLKHVTEISWGLMINVWEILGVGTSSDFISTDIVCQTMSKKRSSTITDWLAGAKAAKTDSSIPAEPASSQGLIQYQPTVEILRDHDENIVSSSAIKNPTTSIEWPDLLASSQTSNSLSAPMDINCNAGCCSFSTAYHPTTQIELESSRNKEGWMCQLQWFQSYKWLSYCKVRRSLPDRKATPMLSLFIGSA